MRKNKKTMNQRVRIGLAGALLAITAAVGGAAHVMGKGAATQLPGIPNPGGTHLTAPKLGPVTFSGQLDRTSVLQGGDGLVRIELVIGADESVSTISERLPTDLVIVLDRSGSMAGEKIAQAKAAVRELVAQLTPEDRFGLVSYANGAHWDIPLQSPTTRAHWSVVVENIGASGGTNMSAGLDAARARLRARDGAGHATRIILISDGQANQGDASFEGLVRRASSLAGSEFILTTVGVGIDFNELLMTALADHGTGNYYFVNDTSQLASVFSEEFEASRTTVATGLSIDIRPGLGVQVVDAAGYPLKRSGKRVSFSPGNLSQGQERRIWVTLRTPNREPGDYPLGQFSLSYRAGDEHYATGFEEAPMVACVADEAQFVAGIDKDGWARSVVVDEFNQLKDEVAGYVRQGRKEDALEGMREWHKKVSTLNSAVRAPAVTQQLEVLADLEAEVQEAFVGRDQKRKQNVLGKRYNEEARDDQRVGSKVGR